jgi:hypothetical protein
MFGAGARKKTSLAVRLSVLLVLPLLCWACAPYLTDSEPWPSPPPPQTPEIPPVETAQPQLPSRTEPQPSRLPEIQFTIQVGAFSTVPRAAAYADRLETGGLDAYYFIDDDNLCKVRFERFDDKEAARLRALDLQAQGLISDFYIVRPRSDAPSPNPLPGLRADLVATARRFIGTPYRWGGASVRDGFDCSGLTMTVYRLNGLELPRNARSQFQAGTPVARGDLKKGDLVFFATNGGQRVSHVGLYTGQGRFIHAPGRGKHIRIASLDNTYFKRRYLGARTYM